MTVSARICLNAAVKAGICAGIVFPLLMVPEMLTRPGPIPWLEIIAPLVFLGVFAAIFGFAVGLVIGFPCLFLLVRLNLARPMLAALLGMIDGALAYQLIIPARSSTVSDLWAGALTGIVVGLLSLKFLKSHTAAPIVNAFKS
ncbi:membrane associated rhomboid family serine protease [Actimicrobium sp. GrIS 1.19]|uniref:hypothetical protein n=1 Tax=Actimicrobium sp. GrIS 1.19 TaxID=3071708 RepID=UPI002DF7FF0D|nr:membrane associated rhomboid family serine protease [Actimicrobium sp. GrIS 1.19]